MANRRQSSAKITPTTKGVETSTQGRRKTIPWVAGRPRAAANPETDLYSQPHEVVTNRQRNLRTPDAIAAAQARMQPANLDDLGEADFGPGAEEEEQEQESETPTPTPTTGNRVTMTYEELQRLIQDSIAQSRIPSIGGAQPEAQPAQQPPQPPPQPRTELVAPWPIPEDVDRLWDWLRADPKSAQAFLSFVPTNSMQLHQLFAAFREAEKSGAGILRSIYLENKGATTLAEGREHIGFGVLSPILGAEKLAVVHLYLSPQRRGYMPQMAAALLELTASHLPGFKFAIIPSDDAQARLYGSVLKPLSFTAHTIYVR